MSRPTGESVECGRKVPRLSLFIASLAIVTLIASTADTQVSEERQIERIRRMIADKGYSWTAGRTSVSGLTDEQKKGLLGFIPPPGRDIIPAMECPLDTIDNPVFDWRMHDGTTPAKDQGGCGACWAFAAAGQLEAHVRIYDHRIEDLSEQQLMDCNSEGFGCGGGWHWTAYEVFRDPGAVGESCYPYREDDGFPCEQQKCRLLARLTDFVSVANSVSSIKHALLDGPVASAISVPCDLFYYTGGCYETDNEAAINHVVIIVGWDDTMNGGAWICKNSWGEDWGENGFFHVAYGECEIGSFCRQIEYTPSVEVIVPNGGELLTAGENCTIRWRIGSLSPDVINIYLSLDGGVSFDSIIASGLTGVNSYIWKTPAHQYNTLRIKVEAALGGEMLGYDTSDENFRIRIINSFQQNYPNPFNGTTRIVYSVADQGDIEINIYDVAGRLVRLLERRRSEPGIYEVTWDGTDDSGRIVDSGLYFSRIEAWNFSRTRKIVYLK